MDVDMEEIFGDIPMFASKEEEVSFWRTKAREMKIKLTESREELDEFQENSRELEAELEAQLQQEEERARDLSSRLTRCLAENHQLKERLELMQSETHLEISELQTNLGQVYSVRDRLSKYVRELEQQNDDLERVKRTMVVSLEDFESRLNQALERNAFLESELDEKESLRDMVQRLKDESRDLRQELAVKQKLTANDQPDTNQLANNRASAQQQQQSSAAVPVDDTNKMAEHKQNGAPLKRTPAKPNSLSIAAETSHTATASPLMEDQVHVPPAGCLISTGTRIDALNIVGDLLRTVATMESRLATCKSYVRDGTSGRVQRTPSVRKPSRIPTNTCPN